MFFPLPSPPPPAYIPFPSPQPTRRLSQSTSDRSHASFCDDQLGHLLYSSTSTISQGAPKTQSGSLTKKFQQTHKTHWSIRKSSDQLTVSKPLPPPPPLRPQDSTSSLIKPPYEGEFNEKPVMGARLRRLRGLMAKYALDYYVVPSEDPHQSEYVPASDRRREFISGFSGSTGQAIISKSSAYLITNSRYWLQAQGQLDENWTLVRAGSVEGPKDWIEWLVGRVKGARIGIDAHMISHEKAALLNRKLLPLGSKLIHSPKNLIDLVWRDRPSKPMEPVYEQGTEFTGKNAYRKLTELREWIRQQPATSLFSKSESTPAQMHVGTLITSLSHIAYILNLRGSDIPYNPLFHAYLFIGLNTAIVFLDASQMKEQVADYLKAIGVERRGYDELELFLLNRGWSEGKLLITPQASCAISLMLTPHRYTIAPSQVEHMMAIKNGTEIDGMRRAHLRGCIVFVKLLAWLENNLSKGYEVTEYEAFTRLRRFASSDNKFIGFTHDHISASGSKAGLSCHPPTRSLVRMIEPDGPYLIGAGMHYRDGTCATARTTHFGLPTAKQCETYTRVLQAHVYDPFIFYQHISMASAVFIEGTSSHQLATLSHKAFSRSGLSFMHGSEHAGMFLSVCDSPQCFSGNVPLMAGHIVSIEPSIYCEGKWGICIQSSYVVRRVKMRDDPTDNTFLGFERLTCVPIQTRMVKESMLTKAERAWLKGHNQSCQEKLSPWLLDDKQARSWVKREGSSGFWFLSTPASPSVEWASE